MSLIQDYCRLLNQLSPRQTHTLAIFAGLLATFALPPFSFWPALIPAFCTAFWLWYQAQSKQRLYNLFFFQLAYNVFSLYWIAFALGVDIKQFFWLIPLTVLVLPIIMALYTCILALVITVVTLCKSMVYRRTTARSLSVHRISVEPRRLWLDGVTSDVTKYITMGNLWFIFYDHSYRDFACIYG